MAEEVAKIGDVKNGNSNRSSKAVAAPFTAMKAQLFVEAPKAAEAVQFYKAAFGAEEVKRLTQPKRKADQELPLVVAAELKIGSATFVVSDLSDDSSALVKAVGRGSVFCLETENVEAAVVNAVKAGGVSEGEITDADGIGKVKDPYGVVWLITPPANQTVVQVEAA